MKNIILILFLLLISCTKNEPAEDPLAKLPAETQVGANTFGCIINGQVFYPRDCSSSVLNPGQRGIIIWGDPNDPSGLGNYNEIEITNCVTGLPASGMMIHLQNIPQLQVADYVWQESNFQSSIDGLMQNYVYARIFDSASKSYKYYSSYQNSGKVTITKYNNIVSGNFSGKLRLYNGTDEIDIKSGRFDINSSTLSSTRFP